jgi:hypothetical protein
MPFVEIKFKRPSGMDASAWEVLKGEALAEVIDETPEDTGNLKRSWEEFHTSRMLHFKTDSSAPYAEYVDKGMSRWPTLSSKQQDNMGFTDRGLDRIKALAGE